MLDNKLQTEQMFQINNSGRYVNVDKNYFIQHLTSPIQLFDVVRHIQTDRGVLELNFTDINGSLYLTHDQLEILFNVSHKTLRDHINNILGSYLEYVSSIRTGGGQIAPPQSHTIYSIPVTYDKPFNMLELNGGGGGGSQNVLFYHHDFICELASRMKGHAAQVIKHTINNIYHEYNKNGFVLNEPLLNTNPEVRQGFVNKAKNYTQTRIKNQELIRGKIVEFFKPCYDFNENDYHQQAMLNGRIKNSLHVYVTGSTAAGIIYSRCNHNLQNCGLTSFAGVNPTKADVQVALNYYDVFEENIYTGAIYTLFGHLGRFAYFGESKSVTDMLKYSVYLLSKTHGSFIPFISDDYHDYPTTAIPYLNEATASHAKKFAVQELEIYRNFLINKQNNGEFVYPVESQKYNILVEKLVEKIIEDNELMGAKSL